MSDLDHLVERIQRLEAENAQLRLYAPARRAQKMPAPVAVGPCNFAYWGIVETDEEFAERAGRQITEVEE